MDKPRDQEIRDPEWENIFRAGITRPETVEESLGRVPIFSLLTQREMRLLSRKVHIRRYQRGETIVRRGAQQSGLYMIRSGSVHIVRRDLEGRREVVGSLGRHELVGEFALLDSSPRSSSLVAAEACELVGFFKPDLMNILVTKPALGCKILLRLGEEMTRSLRKDYRRLVESGFPFPEGEERPESDPTSS